MSAKATSSITIADISDGTDGTGIASTTVTYQAGSSGTTKPTGTWSTSIPSTSASAPYLWTKVTYTYTDGRTPLDVYSVGSTPEGIEVGGKNLYLGTKDFSGGTRWGAINYWNRSPETYNGFTIMVRTGAWCGLYQNFYGNVGETYTFSGYVKKTGGTTYVFTIHGSGICSPDSAVIGTEVNVWEHFSFTTTVTQTGTLPFRVENSSTSESTYICGLKLEKGNKATDWTPAPEDIDAGISSAQSTANTAVSNAATAQSTANTARNEAAAAAKTATNYMNYDSNGLVIGNLTASSLGRNILIDSDSVDIRNGSTVLASYGDNYVYLGKGSVGSHISFCNDKFIMRLNESDFTMTGNTKLNLTSQHGIELYSYASSKNYTDIRMSLTSTTIKSMVVDYDSESIFGADNISIHLKPNDINNKTGINISSGTIALTAGTAKHGSNLLMSGKLANSYYGMTVNGEDSIWIRTTSQGILPYQSGGSSAGHCYLGTSSWYFAYAYIQTIYGTTIYEGGTSLSSKYAAKSHTHSYLPLTGGTVNGTITADDLKSVGGLSITCAYSSTASVACHWKDGSSHALVLSGEDGLSSYLGWSGSSSYATVTTIRGRTCKYSNSSGTSTLSDIRLKKDFRDLDVYDKFFDSIEPCAFRMKTGSSGRYHVGYKAQQIEQALLDSGLTTQDFGGFIRSPYTIDKDDPEGIEVHEEAGIKEGEDELGLIYTEFSAMNTYQIQKCKREISELKSEISELKQIISQLRREL